MLSRTFNASWIADNAASVGSFIFFGVLAMSIVASHHLERSGQRASVRATSALPLKIARIPLGSPFTSRAHQIPLLLGYATARQNEKNCSPICL
jgi:hypothetical protein